MANILDSLSYKKLPNVIGQNSIPIPPGALAPARPPTSTTPVATTGTTQVGPARPPTQTVTQPKQTVQQPAPQTNPNFMTPEEAAGGAAGLEAWQKRIGGVSGSSTGSNTTSTPAPTANTTQSTGTTQAPADDRFAQLSAIIQKLQTAGNITPEEQAIREQLAAQNAATELGLAKINANPEPMDLITGQAATLQQQGLAKGNYLTGQLANLQAQRQAALQSGQAAATAEQALQGFQQPVQLGLGTALVTPAGKQAGETVAGNAAYTATGGGGTQSIMNTLIQQLKNGAAWSDVVSQLPSQALVPMLSQAAQTAIPGFNPTASNQRAAATGASTLQTGTIGGQVTKAAESANIALDLLEQEYNKLSPLQTGGIPLTNNIMTILGEQFGQTAAGNYKTILEDARAQLQGVLSASGAVSPTGAEAMAKNYLPDGMTPDQLKGKIEKARELIAGKVTAFTNSPQTGANTTSTSVGNFVLENGVWKYKP